MTQEMNRRELFRTGATAAAGLAMTASLLGRAEAGEQDALGAGAHGAADPVVAGFDATTGAAVLPPLAYAYDALEPHLDAATMELHHGKHHLGYVTGYNKAMEGLAHARETGDYALAEHLGRKMAFHGAGHVLHCLFWATMSPGGGGAPSGELAKAIDASFGSFERMKAQFGASTGAIEGSGWGIVSLNRGNGRLVINHVQNHHLMTTWSDVALLPLDVWEHAYYLRYQNRRGDYIKAWWNVVDWARVGQLYAATMAKGHAWS